MSNNPLIEQFFARQFGDNPQFQAMLSMMQQKQAEAVETAEVEPATYVPVSELQEHLEKAQARIAQLKRVIAQLESRLDDMEAFEEELAHALGACIHCWGEDPSCRTCLGKGGPGALEPDGELFTRWVRPAIARMQPGLGR